MSRLRDELKVAFLSDRVKAAQKDMEAIRRLLSTRDSLAMVPFQHKKNGGGVSSPRAGSPRARVHRLRPLRTKEEAMEYLEKTLTSVQPDWSSAEGVTPGDLVLKMATTAGIQDPTLPWQERVSDCERRIQMLNNHIDHQKELGEFQERTIAQLQEQIRSKTQQLQQALTERVYVGVAKATDSIAIQVGGSHNAETVDVGVEVKPTTAVAHVQVSSENKQRVQPRSGTYYTALNKVQAGRRNSQDAISQLTVSPVSATDTIPDSYSSLSSPVSGSEIHVRILEREKTIVRERIKYMPCKKCTPNALDSEIASDGLLPYSVVMKGCETQTEPYGFHFGGQTTPTGPRLSRNASFSFGVGGGGTGGPGSRRSSIEVSDPTTMREVLSKALNYTVDKTIQKMIGQIIAKLDPGDASGGFEAYPQGVVTTVMIHFCNSTILWNVSPIGMLDATSMMHKLCREHLGTHTGYEVRADSEGFMCVFPRSNEAVHYMCELSDMFTKAVWPSGIEKLPECRMVRSASGTVVFNGVRVKMGAHTGTPYIAQDTTNGRQGYYGTDVTIAKKLCDIAHDGELLVSSDVVDKLTISLGPTVSMTHVGPVQLGAFGEQSVYRVCPSNLAPYRTFANEYETFSNDIQGELQKCVQHFSPLGVEPPQGDVTLVFTDVQGSTSLWEAETQAMLQGILLHNRVMRELITAYYGYEVKTEGDAFMVAFSDVHQAFRFCISVQQKLLTCAWPVPLLGYPEAAEVTDVASRKLIWKGLRVRMGIHTGKPMAMEDPTSHRMDYFGPMVNYAARVQSKAAGGQIFLSKTVKDALQPNIDQYGVCIESAGHLPLKGIGVVELFSCVPNSLKARSFGPLPPIIKTLERLAPNASDFDSHVPTLKRLEAAERELMRLYDRDCGSSDPFAEDFSRPTTADNNESSLVKSTAVETQHRESFLLRVEIVSNLLACDTPSPGGILVGKRNKMNSRVATFVDEAQRGGSGSRPVSPKSSAPSQRSRNASRSVSAVPNIVVNNQSMFKKSSNLRALSGLLVTHQKLSKVSTQFQGALSMLMDEKVSSQSKRAMMMEMFLPEVISTIDAKARTGPTEIKESLSDIVKGIVTYETANSLSRSDPTVGPKLLKSMLSMMTDVMAQFKDYVTRKRSHSVKASDSGGLSMSMKNIPPSSPLKRPSMARATSLRGSVSPQPPSASTVVVPYPPPTTATSDGEEPVGIVASPEPYVPFTQAIPTTKMRRSSSFFQRRASDEGVSLPSLANVNVPNIMAITGSNSENRVSVEATTCQSPALGKSKLATIFVEEDGDDESSKPAIAPDKPRKPSLRVVANTVRRMSQVARAGVATGGGTGSRKGSSTIGDNANNKLPSL